MTEFKVYSSRIAGELRNQGFFIIRTEPNRKKPWLTVFIFEDTPIFQKEFSKLLSK